METKEAAAAKAKAEAEKNNRIPTAGKSTAAEKATATRKRNADANADAKARQDRIAAEKEEKAQRGEYLRTTAGSLHNELTALEKAPANVIAALDYLGAAGENAIKLGTKAHAIKGALGMKTTQAAVMAIIRNRGKVPVTK